MNTPNKLTVLRIIFVPFYVFFLLMESIPHHFIIALLFFAAASFTDFLDGRIARKKNMITDFGKFADPLADKIMVLSALACFVELGLINSVILILIVSREFIVTSVRLAASSKGKVVAANIWGKVKTVCQIISITAIMLMQYILELGTLNIISIENYTDLSRAFSVAGYALMWITVAATVLSGIIYIIQNFEFIKNAE